MVWWVALVVRIVLVVLWRVEPQQVVLRSVVRAKAALLGWVMIEVTVILGVVFLVTIFSRLEG